MYKNDAKTPNVFLNKSSILRVNFCISINIFKKIPKILFTIVVIQFLILLKNALTALLPH